MIEVLPAEKAFFDAALIAAMQGILANTHMMDSDHSYFHTYEDHAEFAEEQAQALTLKRREILEEEG